MLVVKERFARAAGAAANAFPRGRRCLVPGAEAKEKNQAGFEGSL